ncbi:hypothetical protein NMY22_g10746 [Coprinellus aureogranulatus]|nr:hypothetical protein NMY22_g10746 [Coprinellus aureogranulatus]
MAHLTATEIVNLGKYLDASFDPRSLTVSQLLGVLLHHEVQYPMPYSKPTLIGSFNRHIKANIAVLKKEREKWRQCTASEEGIKDGRTGKSLIQEQKRGCSAMTTVARRPATDKVRNADPVHALYAAHPSGPNPQATDSEMMDVEMADPEPDQLADDMEMHGIEN